MHAIRSRLKRHLFPRTAIRRRGNTATSPYELHYERCMETWDSQVTYETGWSNDKPSLGSSAESRIDAETRRMRAAADIEEIKRDQLADKLIPVEEAEKALLETAAIIKQRLNDMPLGLAQVLASIAGHGDDDGIVRALRIELERYVENLLKELSDSDVQDG